MTAQSSVQAQAANQSGDPIAVLLVDDEQRFRNSLAERLELRGLHVRQAGNAEQGIRMLRQERPDVVVLDRKMPGMDGEEALREIKRLAPEVQVIVLTGYASMQSAADAGRLDAFAYLEKPCETDELLRTIAAAKQEKQYAMARREIPQVSSRSIWSWLWGTNNLRPGMLLLGAVLFAALVWMPTPARMTELFSSPKTGVRDGDPIAGYAAYGKMQTGQSIAQYYSAYAKRTTAVKAADGTETQQPLTPQQTGQAARVMVGTLLVAALFWATGALPVGFTALLVGVVMYVFSIFPPDLVAKSYAKDAVFFIAGVLALSVGIAKTGLDRRIGLLLLGTSKSLPRMLFIFLPLLALCASFFSEHALVAFIGPILMLVYRSAMRAAGLAKDRALAVLFILGICFAANQGGPGSPAAGGRNAVMIGILADYGQAPSFGQWMLYGLPYVPVMALVVAAYFYLALGRKVKVGRLNVANLVRQESDRLGPMSRDEYITAATLLLVVVLWCMGDEEGSFLGMGGPVMIGICILAIFRILTWPDVNKIAWDVVALYGSACALGAGLANTGAALWLADSFVRALPPFMQSGEGLCIATSLFTAVLTNFMSDGATVSAIGPVAVPMATLSGTHPWMVGFATAFASSFANALIIGTPNNAIAYALAKDPQTGEQLVTLKDFFRHGLVITGLALLVLWGWAVFGYWRWIGF